MRNALLIVASCVTGFLWAGSSSLNVVTDIQYDSKIESAKGDLWLPTSVTADTPMVLIFHGGGWTGGSRRSLDGVAAFFRDELGFAVFNVEYRLATSTGENRWPAGGDDCVTAAKFVLGEDFKRAHGLGYDKVMLCGYSAGAHLALWTLVNLPVEKVSGCISVSGVGDPQIAHDAGQTYADYFVWLFDKVTPENLEKMNPCTRVKPGMAPVLCTHALEDDVVPIASHRAFETAYKNIGNDCLFCEYGRGSFYDPPLTGHAIWVPGSNPQKMIPAIENQVRRFANKVLKANRWRARPMSVGSVEYGANAAIEHVNLLFGCDNGLTNRLYRAWGSCDGGTRLGDWEHVDFVGSVTDEMNSLRVDVPIAANQVRFFLDVPFPGGKHGELLDCVQGDGTANAYVDTGFKLKGGDVIRTRVYPADATSGSVLGSRTNVDTADIVLAFASTGFVVDYCGSGLKDDYKKTRLEAAPMGHQAWYDIELSPSCRSVTPDGGTGMTNDVLCTHTFETPKNCYLFKASESPSVTANFKGSIASFSVMRNSVCLADYLPCRLDGKDGFLDRVTGTFKTATGFTGPLSDETSPLTSFTQVIVDARKGRSISVASRTADSVSLVFGEGSLDVERLYCAWGDDDGGTSTNGWEHVEYLGEILGNQVSYEAEIPAGAKCLRFFLGSSGDCNESVLEYVSGDGAHYIDTGVVLRGGDVVKTRFRPTSSAGAAVLGARQDANNKDIRLALLENYESQSWAILDYCDSGDCNDYRQQIPGGPGWYKDQWMDAVLSAPMRSIKFVGDAKAAVQDTPCLGEFETPTSCWLFWSSGSTEKKFDGDIAQFSVMRGEQTLADYVPYRRGTSSGFVDRVTGRFLTAEGLTGSADVVGAEDPMTFSPLVRTPLPLCPDRSVSVVGLTSASVDLAFGPDDNGLANVLYMAWGEMDGGAATGGWEHVECLGMVAGNVDSWRASVPKEAKFLRFFLERDESVLEYVSGDGVHYIDTGVVLHGGDVVKTRFCPRSSAGAAVLGARQDAYNKDIRLALLENFEGKSWAILDYCGSGDCLDYRQQIWGGLGWYKDQWMDAMLSASMRSIQIVGADKAAVQDTPSLGVFETPTSCWLFWSSGSTENKFSGDIAQFSIARGEQALADYVPYRRGTSYGFVDRVTGKFLTAEGLSGSADVAGVPLMTTTATVCVPEPRDPGRSVSVVSLTSDTADLAFGPDNGQANVLYMAWGGTDGGAATGGWEHVECLGAVAGDVNVWRADVPKGAKCLRFFLESPVGHDESVLEYVSGDGTHYVDTGVVLHGGDVVKTRFCPRSSAGAAVLGARQDAHNKDIRLALLENFNGQSYAILDYCGSGNCLDYRLQIPGGLGWYKDQWMDAVLSAPMRSIKFVGAKAAVQETPCLGVFETPTSCWLFWASGSTEGKFSGDIAQFSIVRSEQALADYVPYRRGTSYGFVDRVTGKFLTAEGLSGSADVTGAPLMTVTSLVEPPVATVDLVLSFVLDETLLSVTWTTNGVVTPAVSGATIAVLPAATVSVAAQLGDWCVAEGTGDYVINESTNVQVTARRIAPEEIVAQEGATASEIKAALGIDTAVFDGSDEATTKTNLARVVRWAETCGCSPANVNAAVFDANGVPVNDMATAYLLNVPPSEVAEATVTAQQALRIVGLEYDATFGQWTVQSAAGQTYGNGRVEIWSSDSLTGPFAPTAAEGDTGFFRARLVK